MRQQNKHISNFRTFESKEEFISIDDIKEIFIDLIDKEYRINSYNLPVGKYGKYFFEFIKNISHESIGEFNKGSAYGYSKLDVLKKEFDIFDILDDSKERLNSMGYTIGFEFESNLTVTSDNSMKIICHMQHSKFNKDQTEEAYDGETGLGMEDSDEEEIIAHAGQMDDEIRNHTRRYPHWDEDEEGDKDYKFGL